MTSRFRAGASLTAVAALLLSPLVPITAAVAAPTDIPRVSAPDAALELNPAGTYETGVFDESAAEIVQAFGNRLFVVNAQAGVIDVLDYSDPTAITKEFSLASDGVANSVAIRSDGLGVVAIESTTKTDPGHLVFFDATAGDAEAARLGEVTVGALPDMVTISSDGSYAVVANEGEPADDFSSDPEGSVGIVALPEALAAPAQSDVRTADFHDFEEGGAKTLPEGVRVFGPQPHGDDLPVSRNLEPEYVTVDGETAYVALQEANAVASVDLATAEVTEIWPLTAKDHGVAGSGLDPSDRDPRDASTFDIRTFDGLKGLPLPDGMTSYQAGDETFLVAANEGDAREWGDYVESVRAADLAEEGYGPVCEGTLADLSLDDADLGRLNVTIEEGFDEALGCYTELYAFGTRSFSIWSTSGELVFDSGEDFERITAEAAPEFFNSNHSESNFEGRSDDKGPEPENLAIGEIAGRTYAFIGFERVGGIIVYDITDPAESAFVTYVNNRDFSFSVEDADDQATALAGAGDLGPEGIAFISAADSATGAPLLAVGNEVSGTTTLFEIVDLLAPVNESLPPLTGTPDVGSRLTASPGTWSADDLAFTYQWTRDGEPIRGATRASYRVTVADQGAELAVTVTATDGEASGSATSEAVFARALTAATVKASPFIATSRTPVTVTVRLHSAKGVVATGEVTVRIGRQSFTGEVVDGVARIEVGKLSRGTKFLTATYGGDAKASPAIGLGALIVL